MNRGPSGPREGQGTVDHTPVAEGGGRQDRKWIEG